MQKTPECEKNDTPKIKCAPVPQPVPQYSMVSATAAAHMLLQKYLNAMPLYRQEAEWVELGLKTTRATLESEGTLAGQALKMIQELSNKEKEFAKMTAVERQAARLKEEQPIQD